MRTTALAILMVWMAGGCAVMHQLEPGGGADVPAAELRTVAAAIERAVQGGERTPELPDAANLKLDTGGIRLAISGRAARHELFDQLLDAGYVVEKRNGLPYIQKSKAYREATTSSQRDRHALLVMGESQDRWALYEGIQQANEMSGKALPVIQRIFFEARTELMEPGQLYEGPDGEIIVKR